MRSLIIGLDSLVALHAPGSSRELAAAVTLADLGGADAVRLGVEDGAAASDESLLRNVRRAAGRLELRMAPEPGLLKLALEARPERVILTSQPRPAGSRPQPFDWRTSTTPLGPVVSSLREAGIQTLVLAPPDLEAVKAAHACEADGVELFTGHLVDLPPVERSAALQSLNDAARLAAKLRMALSVGGALDLRSTPEVLEAVPMAESLCVGRAFVSRAVLLGIDRAIADLRARL